MRKKIVPRPGWGWSYRVAVLALLAGLDGPGPAAAQQAAVRRPVPAAAAVPQPMPLAVTVSGGVSLGAYEAGYLYYMTEVVKRNPKFLEPRVLTGASAGSINSLLAILALCLPPESDPTQSLFYKTWTEIGFNDLFVQEDASKVALFSRRSFARVVNNLEKVWNAGLPTSCDLQLGVSVTNLVGRQVGRRSDLLRMPRTEEHFALRIQGQGPGKPPRLSNYQNPDDPLTQSLLAIDDATPGSPLGSTRFWPLRELLFASSAFPLAFPPQPLSFCHVDSRSQLAPDSLHPLPLNPAQREVLRRESLRCAADSAHARRELFIDGGVFDNQPLRLANRIVRGGLIEKPGGGYTWRDLPQYGTPQSPESLRFHLVIPSSRAYPELTDDKRSPEKSGVAMISHFLRNFVTNARARDLYTSFELEPGLIERTSVSKNHLPMISELLEAFFGFFDRKLRIFDYYLGMLDAQRFLIEDALPGVQRLFGPAAVLRLPEAASSRDLPAWQPFLCLLDSYEGRPSEVSCRGEPLTDFRILLQIAYDRLYDHCSALVDANQAVATKHPHCERAYRGGTPPLIAAEAEALHTPPAGGIRPRWRAGRNEDEFDYVMRLFAAYRFEFTDFGLARKDAARAQLHIRNKLTPVLKTFAAAQPRYAGVFSIFSTPLLDAFRYLPPRHTLYLLIGSHIELGYSITSPTARWSWLRPAVSIAFDGLGTVFDNRPNYLGIIPMVGLELEPLPISSSVFQLRLGARLGPLLSTNDLFFSRECQNLGSESTPCSRLVTNAYVALSLLNLLRVQLGGSFLPAVRAGEAAQWSILPSIGVQFQSFL